MRPIRAALFSAILLITAIIGSIWGHMLRRMAPERLLPLGQAWSRMLVKALRLICGITVDVRGLETLPGGPVLIAAQHQSAFDTMIWLTLLKKPSYVLKEELTRLPLFGGLFAASGHIPLDRSGGARSLRNLIGAVQLATKEGRQIIIFPEGTRVRPGERVPLQVGIAALARATGLPVVPAATNSGLFWPRDWLKLRPGVIHIRIHPPIPASTDRATMIERLEAIFYEGELGIPADQPLTSTEKS